MNYNLKQIDYQELCENLKYNIKNRLGTRFCELYINDYETDNYDISLCLILNVDKTEVMDTYLEALDDVIDMEFKYDLIISVVPFSATSMSDQGGYSQWQG